MLEFSPLLKVSPLFQDEEMRDTRSDTESEISDSEKEEENEEKGKGGGGEDEGEDIENLGDKTKELEEDRKFGVGEKSEGEKKDKAEIRVERHREETEDKADMVNGEIGDGGESAAMDWGEQSKNKTIDSGEKQDGEIGTELIECLKNATTLEVFEGRKDEVEDEDGEDEREAARRRRGEEKEEKTEKEAIQ